MMRKIDDLIGLEIRFSQYLVELREKYMKRVNIQWCSP